MANDINDQVSARRSPPYPYIDLEEAVEKTRIAYQIERGNAVAPEIIACHWKYGEKSSGGGMCVSALRKFGLLEEIGRGPSRQGRFTKIAQTIVPFDGSGHGAG